MNKRIQELNRRKYKIIRKKSRELFYSNKAYFGCNFSCETDSDEWVVGGCTPPIPVIEECKRRREKSPSWEIEDYLRLFTERWDY
jgi:hypothetical protein